MPSKQEILDGLRNIANRYSLWALLLHVIFYVLVIVLTAKWLPEERLLSIILCLPLVTVAAFALITGNPFNGFMFSILSVLILVLGFTIPDRPVSYSNPVFLAIGIYMILFGLVYPHFLKTRSFTRYLISSPFGLIPCPTLSVVIGFLLIFNGLSSPVITLALVVFGLFYGLFGTLKLRVYLDIFLIFGTVALLVMYWMGL